MVEDLESRVQRGQSTRLKVTSVMLSVQGSGFGI